MTPALLISLLLATALPGQRQPLSAVPAGWVHFPQWSPDRWTGAYYDAVSGVYVSYSISLRQTKPAWTQAEDAQPTDEVSTGTLEGTTYTMVKFGDARRRVVRQMEKDFGFPIDVLGDDAERRLPPPNASMIAVTFFPRGGEGWVFDAAVCSEEQEMRFRGLVLSAGRLNLDAPGAQEPAVRAGLSFRQYETLALATSLTEVLRIAGPPLSTYRPNCAGVALVYSLEIPCSPRPYQAVLLFDEKQSLRRRYVDGPLGVSK